MKRHTASWKHHRWRRLFAKLEGRALACGAIVFILCLGISVLGLFYLWHQNPERVPAGGAMTGKMLALFLAPHRLWCVLVDH